MVERIALGTAQFGMRYGINNRAGQVEPEEVRRILAYAAENGILTIDTAAAYGTSEEVLGRFLRGAESPFHVISKFNSADGRSVDKAFERSVLTLGVNRLYGYLIHSFSDYLRDRRIWEEVRSLRTTGAVEHIGFSLYRPSELEEIFERGLDVDLIQVPYSVLDRRFEGILESAKKDGVEIHVRSVFLQGLVFKHPSSLSPFFNGLLPNLRRLIAFSERVGITIPALCLGSVLRNPSVDRAIVGVEFQTDLEANIRSVREAADARIDWVSLKDIACSDERLVVPSYWPREASRIASPKKERS